MRLALIAFGSLALAACGGSPETSSNQPPTETASADELTSPPVAPVQAVNLSQSDKGRICRAAVASINGRDPGIIQVTRTDGNIVQTRYTRDDGTVWKHQCRIEAGRVVWAAIDVNGPGTGPGRWRNEDEILYSLDGDKIHIRQSEMGELIADDTFTVP